MASMASRRARGMRMMTTVIALVCASCASSRGIVAQTTTQATWPIVKDLELNVVDVGAREGSGDTIIRALGGTSVRADAVIFETVAYAEYDASGAGAMADVSARLFDAESRAESLRTALKAAENDVPTLADGVKTCEDGRAALLAEVEALEAAWDGAGARFTPPTCTGPGARNLIYVRDAMLGHNVWSCVCKNDYTGVNCEIPPCDTSAFTTLGSCAVANTLAVGASCDLSCASGSVQDTPLTCTLQGGVGVLNAPLCTACDSCTSCDGPDKTGFDYTDHTGVNCKIPPCDLSLAPATVTLRPGETCDQDANGKIKVGATCNIDCGVGTSQVSPLMCSYDSRTDTNYFNSPECTACTGDYTGANCAIAPCDTSEFATLGSCAVANTLAVGAQCDVSCGSNSVQDTPLKCTLQDGVGVLNAPTCTECNLCTDCDGPGKNNFDYTDYTGANCASPPCDLSLATSEGYALRVGGTCDLDANGKIISGATCDIECAANSVQDSQLTCSYDSSTDTSSFTAPTCVPCTSDYTGANCAIAPCNVAAYTNGSCASLSTLPVGGSCDLSCSEVGEVRDAPLRCELQGGVGVLIEPTCTACNSCTSCDGPGSRINFDYTDHTGADCGIPPCDVSVAATEGYPVREGGTCAVDANQKIPVGATCDIDCEDSVQDSQLTCTWDGTSSSFNAPSCVACTGNYTGANCVTAPCIVGSGASDGSCGAALAVNASCAQYCAETGKFLTSASTCSASGSTISSPGPCRQMDFTLNGYPSSFKLSTSTISSKVDGVQQFNITTAEYGGSLFTNNGDEKYYYSAIDLTVSKSGIYHVSWQHAVSPSGDYVMLIYRNSFNPDKPARNLAFGNDDAYINVNSNTYPEATDGNWYDGKNYYTGKYAPAAFVSLDEDVSYVLVFTSYYGYSTYPSASFEVPAQVSLTCGMLDFDGPDTAYAYHDDQELVDNLALTRGYCSVRAWAP